MRFFSGPIVTCMTMDVDRGNLAEWYYTTNSQTGVVTLFNYKGTSPNIIVPKAKGKAVLNSFGLSNRNSITSVDYQHVPLRDLGRTEGGVSLFYNLVTVKNLYNGQKNMGEFFRNCRALNCPITIPSSATNVNHTFNNCVSLNSPVKFSNKISAMDSTFNNCRALNQSINIPSSVTILSSTFRNCVALNQPVPIPGSVISMYEAFMNCSSFNQPIDIPSSVTNMDYTFYNCTSFNKSINIPSLMTSLNYTFHNCYKFNQSITVSTPSSTYYTRNTFQNCYALNKPMNINTPRLSSTFDNCNSLNSPITLGTQVVSIDYAFSGCTNFGSTITIYSTEITVANGRIPSTKPKQVYIYFQYANGVYTKTYNILVTNSSKKWDGVNNTTVINMGKAPW